jgi:hypothetical protein
MISAAPQTWSRNALSFDGVNDYVSIPGFGASAPTTEITIEFWQQVSAVRQQLTFNLSPFQDNNRISAHVPFSDGVVYWDFGNRLAGGRLTFTPPASIVGTWQHFAFVASQSGNYMRIYYNGGVYAEQKLGMTPFSRYDSDLEIGSSLEPFAGLIDEFRVWNVARSQAQILANMNQP